ncbi:hypothetical protein KV557_09955 [Kitasatospora aureofaciens]|uniref:hypothetical protein n=1 Tax=Kitasatospora aureofaciens TaxID=1894 RepID=UPI001C4745E4|nr:hypothetical protein [Kitasatospora aureofaciens]MBV6697447.1 hypothetical protein [Kitasatospora aureofaciens]
MSSPPDSGVLSQPPDPPGPTSDRPEPPREGDRQAPGGALAAAGAWPLIRKQIF